MSDTDSVVITAFITNIDCPHCTLPNNGFVNDPRGGDFECTGCHQKFHVPEDAEIDFG